MTPAGALSATFMIAMPTKGSAKDVVANSIFMMVMCAKGVAGHLSVQKRTWWTA